MKKHGNQKYERVATAALSLRCPPVDKERWQQAAKEQGETLNAWVVEKLNESEAINKEAYMHVAKIDKLEVALSYLVSTFPSNKGLELHQVDALTKARQALINEVISIES